MQNKNRCLCSHLFTDTIDFRETRRQNGKKTPSHLFTNTFDFGETTSPHENKENQLTPLSLIFDIWLFLFFWPSGRCIVLEVPLRCLHVRLAECVPFLASFVFVRQSSELAGRLPFIKWRQLVSPCDFVLNARSLGSDGKVERGSLVTIVGARRRSARPRIDSCQTVSVCLVVGFQGNSGHYRPAVSFPRFRWVPIGFAVS